MSYGIYNIGAKILPLKPELYSNSQPHRSKPNLLWTKTLSLYTKISITPETINNPTFKSFYQILLKLDPNSNPILNTTTPHTWLRLTLAKPRPSLFSNLEKEIFFRKPYKGYTWGCFFPNTILNLVALMTFFVKFSSLLPMNLTIFSFTALSLNNYFRPRTPPQFCT